MSRKKHVRERGKLKFSEYFKDLEVGEKVALVKEPSVNVGFHKRMQGRTGVIVKKQGRSYVVKVKDLNMEKILVLPPIHLKRIKTTVGEKQ